MMMSSCHRQQTAPCMYTPPLSADDLMTYNGGPPNTYPGCLASDPRECMPEPTDLSRYQYMSGGSPYSYCLYSSELENPEQSHLSHQVKMFWEKRVICRKLAVAQALHDVMMVAECVLGLVGQHEPRFNYRIQRDSLSQRYLGVRVESAHEFTLGVYLNHMMSVFSIIEEMNQPGLAALKLSDGKKRSMSLWVEFITASGFLSSRKLKCKFLSVVTQILKSHPMEGVALLRSSTDDCVLLIGDVYILNIVPVIRWKGQQGGNSEIFTSPSQLNWSQPQASPPLYPADIQIESVDLEARGYTPTVVKPHFTDPDKQCNSSEADSWQLSYREAEDNVLKSYNTNGRRDILSLLKCLRDRHLSNHSHSSTIDVNNHILLTLVLYEMEKHPDESSWTISCYAERINSILLQLKACLHSGSLSHYFKPNLNLLRLHTRDKLRQTGKLVWSLARQIIVNPYCFNIL